MSQEPVTFKDYILGEWVEEYQEGLMSRRDLFRRVLQVTGSAAGAAAFLSASGCTATPTPTAAPAKPAAAPSPAGAQPTAAAPAKPAAVATAPAAAASPTLAAPAKPAIVASPSATASPTRAVGSAGVTVSPTDSSIQVAQVTYKSGDADIRAYLARPAGNGPFPAVIISHENRGTSEHFRDVARRYAKAGYVGLAPDLMSREGGTEALGDQVPAMLSNIPADRFATDMQAGLDYLKTQAFVAPQRLGATGYCFGGGVIWRLAFKSKDLKAAAPYYGPPPNDLKDQAGNVTAAMFVVLASRDQRINDMVPPFEEELKKQGKTVQVKIYPDADHAFFNDTQPAGPRYNAQAAQQAWRDTLEWFEKYLKA
ncbi:MAG: dienelactone hydrolase family protein [Chloroflexi bacterium]|nr:dienelactone hydrolase family protein [Chloroflexota bacterium]